MGAMGLRELPEEPGIAHTGFADNRDDVALTTAGPLERLVELAQFGVTPHKARQAPRSSSLKPRARQSTPVSHRPRWFLQPLNRHRSQGLDLDIAFDQAQDSAVIKIEPGIAICSMRAARWVVWPTAV